MATVVDFKRYVDDFAKLENGATISIGTTGFSGDGNRLFLNFNDVGILFSHDDAAAFLEAAARAANRLGYET
ncbi:hypothetical protein [Phaeobacter sp. B1627]|uniref:hypothetical protein n=1 Tax=Phaeobacter sp. B1627 TaxID=2583809 RepID=UPI00111BBF76|nr:hypothetical protein [Phaeobacter sp. B1627]TNJ42319.1 hypothetical protein FGE21_11600 [Phaeobacter sp. B1627]